MNLKSSFRLDDNADLHEFFRDCVIQLETSKEVRDKNLIGLKALLDLIVMRNCDVVPYFRFICNKFGHQNRKRTQRFHGDDRWKKS